MKKRLIAALMALCLLVGVLPAGLPAHASGYVVYVVSNTLPAYQYPSAGSRVLGVMSYGEIFRCLSTSGQWARIRNSSGAIGYCLLSGLSTEDPNVLGGKVTINANGVKVYAKPTTSARVMMTLRKGSSYTARAITTDGQWYRLQNGQYFGYVQSRYISGASSGGQSDNSSGGVALPRLLYVKENVLNIYKSASASAGLAGMVPFGQAVTCHSVDSNGWARVSGGISGYCPLSSLTTVNPNTLSYSVTIHTGGTKVYAYPTTVARVMMTLRKGSAYTARAITADGQWYRLQNGQYFGYVHKDYITDSRRPADSQTTPETPVFPEIPETPDTPDLNVSIPVYVNVNVANVYQSMSTASTVTAMLPFGQNLTCVRVSGDWAQVSGSASGYCLMGNLSDINPNDISRIVTINANGVKVYAYPITTARVMMTLNKNAVYKAVAVTPDGQWYRLQNGQHFGYVQRQYITDPLAPDNPGQETPGQETPVYVIDDTLKVYSAASESSPLVRRAAFGEQLTLIRVDDGWANVRFSDGVSGCCRYGGVSTANPCIMNTVYYAQRDGVKVYDAPADDANQINTLRADYVMTVVGKTGSGVWARASLSGLYGYVRLADIGTEKVGAVEDPNAIVDIEPRTIYVADTTHLLYAANSISAKALGTMSFGESLTITGSGGGWARVRTAAGVTGYCKESGLTNINPNSVSITLYVQKDGVKAYNRPSTSATSLGTMSTNMTVTGLCTNADGTWVRAKNSNGVIGYIQTAYLSTSKVNTSAKVTDAIVALAKAQLDKKYVYAAEGPNNFDCSGLTWYVYKNVTGINLKRTAYQQGYDERYTKITSIAALRVGDLVFFNTSSDSDLCDHAGIYLGGNEFIHASSSGGRVMISSLSASASGGYYNRNFSWGRRIL